MLVETLLIMGVLMLVAVGQSVYFNETAPFFRAFDSHTKHEWVNRITASLVEIGIIGFGLASGPISTWAHALGTAYFLHDTAHMLLYESEFSPYIHHVVAFAVLLLMKYAMSPAQNTVAIQAVIALEATSPVLHTTWLLNKAGYRDYPFFKYLMGGAAAFFGVMRVGVLPWLMHSRMDLSTAAVFAPILGLNIFWFWKLIKMLRKALRPKTDQQSKE